MKLEHVTFTGLDEHTDLDRLEDIQEMYPYAEFGVLMSYNWSKNGNRYPKLDPFLYELDTRCLHLSAHICGQMARDVAAGKMDKVHETMCCMPYIFQRCQLNISVSDNTFNLRSANLEGVILQMKNLDELVWWETEILGGGVMPGISYLIDGSGGKGLDTNLEIYPHSDITVGYAGGFNPSNVEEKLRKIYDSGNTGKFWIDMESGVRTDNDWFDLDKVEEVLKICDPLIKEYEQL
jgi:hypothetical protein